MDLDKSQLESLLATGVIRKIPLTQGKVALVDEADYERLSAFQWCAQRDHQTWYAVTMTSTRSELGRKKLRMHRVILNAPDGVQVDHRDCDGLNNTRNNLRLATGPQNNQNARLRRDNKSGFKGVHKRGSRWLAQIKSNQTTKHIGRFDDPVTAAKAYDKHALKLHGEFARLNFPANAETL